MRGRNIFFANKIGEALQLDKLVDTGSLAGFKAAFTSEAVRAIHEAAMEAWPPNIDIISTLQTISADVSGLYIGDYDLEYISRGLVRHSIYANKILVVDPFVYPPSVRDEYNPILNPEQYRSQTLRNVNFYFSLLPWIEAGIVEVIRTPADFDRELNWESMKRQERKFDEHEELKKALEKTAEEWKKRHREKEARRLFCSAPDFHIRKIFKESEFDKQNLTEDEFVDYINSMRARDPDFLEPIGPESKTGQLFMLSSGANYEIAKLTAKITGSYIVTDLHSRWIEMELDRTEHNAKNTAWAPFAKAIQDAPLTYLNELSLEHALRLRNEGRLEGLRGFLYKVWRGACSEKPFDEANAEVLAVELGEEVRKAEVEWAQIRQDLVKIVGAEVTTGLLASGPLIATGQAGFLAAALAAGGGATFVWSKMRKRGFPDKFPAAFFMGI